MTSPYSSEIAEVEGIISENERRLASLKSQHAEFLRVKDQLTPALQLWAQKIAPFKKGLSQRWLWSSRLGLYSRFDQIRKCGEYGIAIYAHKKAICALEDLYRGVVNIKTFEDYLKNDMENHALTYISDNLEDLLPPEILRDHINYKILEYNEAEYRYQHKK